MAKKGSKLNIIVFFFLCFSLGLSVFFSVSSDYAVQRDPAAIEGSFFHLAKYSSEQIRQQIYRNIKIFPTNAGRKTLRLDGFSSALCSVYPTIELEFIAEGVVIADEFPRMKIKAPCVPDQDPAELASIIIPVENLLNERPKNAEFIFDGFNSRFEFSNMADLWPRIWILDSVSFKTKTATSKTIYFHKNENGDSFKESPENQMIVLEF